MSVSALFNSDSYIVSQLYHKEKIFIHLYPILDKTKTLVTNFIFDLSKFDEFQIKEKKDQIKLLVLAIEVLEKSLNKAPQCDELDLFPIDIVTYLSKLFFNIAKRDNRTSTIFDGSEVSCASLRLLEKYIALIGRNNEHFERWRLLRVLGSYRQPSVHNERRICRVLVRNAYVR